MIRRPHRQPPRVQLGHLEPPRRLAEADLVQQVVVLRNDLRHLGCPGQIDALLGQDIQRQQDLPPGQGRPVKHDLAQHNARQDDQEMFGIMNYE